MADRIKLTVTSVEEPKAVGDKGAKKLQFKAKNPEGKELSYFTFSNRFFPSILKDAVIDADVETTTRETETATYTDRKVIQIYQDGQPVGGQKQGWRNYDDSPEKRRSIERQTSLQIAAQMSEPTDSLDGLLGKAQQIYEWLSEGKKPETILSRTQDEASPSKQGGQGKAQQVESVNPPAIMGKIEAAEPTTLQELLSWVAKQGKSYTPSWVCRQLNVKAPTEIKNIKTAYLTLKEKGGW